MNSMCFSVHIIISMIVQYFSHHSELALHQNYSFGKFCGTAGFWIQQMCTASDMLVLVRPPLEFSYQDLLGCPAHFLLIS